MRTVINNKENDTTTIKSNNENYKGNINNMTLSIQIDNINNNDGGQMILRYGKFGLVCTWNLPQSKTYHTRRSKLQADLRFAGLLLLEGI